MHFNMIASCILTFIVCCQISQALDDTTQEFFTEMGTTPDEETQLSSAELTKAEMALLDRANAATDEGVFEQPFEQNGYLEGDIGRIPGGDARQNDDVQAGGVRQNAAIDDATARWPDATVPYAISAAYTEKGRSVIAQAILAIQRASCVRFVPKQQHADYIYLTPAGGGCSSDVGRMGLRQEVVLGSKECMVVGVIVHELMHALGFYHEQSRNDRNKFVKIIWANMEPAMDRNFLRYASMQIDMLGTPYDYESIMHYGPTAFSKNGEPTILPNIEEARIGQRHKLSDFDIYELNALYNCSGNHTMPEWPFSDSQSSALCGSDTYDVLTEGCCDGRRFALASFICCQNTVVPFAWGAGPRVECCGVEAIAPPMSCCNGSAMDTRDHVCCPPSDGQPEQPFDIHQFACCRGTLHRLPLSGRWDDYSCCASNLIANESHDCCGDEYPFFRKTQGCCSANVYDKKSEFCCNLVIHPIELGTARRTACCAGKPYDTKAHQCCGGSNLYVANSQDEICCGGLLHRNQRDLNLRCCQGLIETKSRIFSRQTHGCCAEGQLNSTVYAYVEYKCCDGHLSPLTSHLLAMEWQGDLRCCDSSPFNAETHMCCLAKTGLAVVPLAAGLRHSERDRSSTCCGAVSMNTRTHLCCDSVPASLAESDHLNGSVSRQVLHQQAGCCGKVVFNMSSHGCCGYPLRQVVPLAAGLPSAEDAHALCCGDGVNVQSLNADTHDCCGGTVTPLGPGLILLTAEGQLNRDAACCGIQSYNAATHSCCEGHVTTLATRLNHAFPAVDSRSSCCHTKSVNLASHTCCSSGEIIRKGQNCTGIKG